MYELDRLRIVYNLHAIRWNSHKASNIVSDPLRDGNQSIGARIQEPDQEWRDDTINEFPLPSEDQGVRCANPYSNSWT
jgi:hypothetical protein